MSDISRVTVNLLENDYIVTLGGVKDLQIESVKIPDAPVERDWFPNIEDYLVFRGNRLVEGMVVILNDKSARFSEKDLYHCIVTKLEFTDDLMSFVGIYADGTAVHHRYNISYMWAVEKGTGYKIVESPNLQSAIKQAMKFIKAIHGITEILPDDEQSFSEVEIPAEKDMTDAEREHYGVETEPPIDPTENRVGPKTKQAHSLKVLDIIDIFGKNHVVMFAEGVPGPDKLHMHTHVELLDLETRMYAAQFTVPANAEITVIGALV